MDSNSEPRILLFRARKAWLRNTQYSDSNVKLHKDDANQGKELVGLLIRGS